MYMVDDPTLFETKIATPGTGVHGTMGVEKSSLGGAPLENSSRSHQPLLDTPLNVFSNNFLNTPVAKDEKNSEIFLREPFDPAPRSQHLEYLEPAILAKKILSKTQYDPKFAVEMVSFFLSREKSRDIEETFVWKRTGEVDTRVKTVANPPPMFSEFGRTIGVSEKTLLSWAKNHPEFGEAYEVCQDIIQEFMITNGLSGDYSSQFGIFTAKNITKMKDVQVNKNENYDMKSILDQIEKGQYGTN